MSSALECWSTSTTTTTTTTTTTDDDNVEQVLMSSHHRSELDDPLSTTTSATTTTTTTTTTKDSSSSSSSAMQKRFHKISRNVSEAIASLKNSLNLDSSRDPPPPPSKLDSNRKIVWGSVVRSLTQLYPGSQLPEKLVSNIRKHYDSMPLSYAQAGFDMKDVFVHIRLIDQACVEDQPAILIQDVSVADSQACVYNIIFACNSSISWPAVSGALENGSICCNKIQIFEKKGSTLGVIHILVQDGQEKNFKNRFENALRSASRKPKLSNRKLPFGLCGCQEDSGKGRDFGEIEEDFSDQSYRNSVEHHSNAKFQLSVPLPSSSFLVSVDEWQTVRGGGDDIGKWLLTSDTVEFTDQVGPNSYKGLCKGKRVAIEKLKGCDKGNTYDFEVRKDLLELMTCGHKNVIPFYGVCVDDIHGLCVVTRFMEGGSVHDLMLKNKKLQTKDVMRIAVDVAEGIKFMNEHGVAYRDLNTQRILLDRQGNACLGDMGIVTACKSMGEVMDYETDGYRWLAPEIIAADPESASETWMSNVYSFGMVLWEMVTGEAAYSALSPVQAAVGIAACGLRPEIPKDCPQVLKSVMLKCWNNIPTKRPQFSEIITLLLRPNCNTTLNNR